MMTVFPKANHRLMQQNPFSSGAILPPEITENRYGTLGYLQHNFLSEAEQWFSYKMQQALKTDNPLDSLGVQAYATYPGVRGL